MATVSCAEICSSSKSNQLHFPNPGVPPIKILRWLGQTDGVLVAFRQMLLNSKIDECFHIYKWSFSGGPTTINFPISKWTFFQGMYSPFRTEIKDPGLDSSQNINYGSIWKAFETVKHFFSFASRHTFLYPQCQDSWEAKAPHESPRWCWFPHPPPDSPTGHWSAVVSGGQHAALSLVESLHIPASDWCGQWSAGQDWPPAARHWSAVTSGLVRPARQKLSPTHNITSPPPPPTSPCP